MSGNYASGGITMAWNGEDISEGYQGINLSPKGDLQEASYDLKGKRTLSQLADQSATLTVTYTQTENTVKNLETAASALQLTREFISVPTEGVILFEDPTGNTGSFLAWNVALLSTGDEDWAATVGERTVTFDVEKLIRHKDPASVLSNIAQYL
ncbi:conserved hypothetical protein [Vibrio phage 424E50-1]|nr:conserved hypothetical protein [Vibrio phage 424E50-1]CAH9012715.1 conserved hypothetical protein [Vibrio phage 501E54-1]